MNSPIAPDNFYAQPIAWGRTALGHWAIPFILSYIIAVVWFSIFGEYPYRWAMFAVIACIYVFIIELPQKGEVFDSLEDTAFWVYGALCFAVFPKEAITGQSPFAPTPLPIGRFAMFVAHLAVGFGIRVWQAYRDGKRYE